MRGWGGIVNAGRAGQRLAAYPGRRVGHLLRGAGRGGAGGVSGRLRSGSSMRGSGRAYAVRAVAAWPPGVALDAAQACQWPHVGRHV